MKLLFAPLGIAAGLVAGILARKGFERAWAVVDDEPPPDPGQREVPVLKLLFALALEGAIFRLVKGAAEHGARRGFATLTGRWPGEQQADQ